MDLIYYTDLEHRVWKEFFLKQYEFACAHSVPLFQQGMEILSFNRDKIPNIIEVSELLKSYTGFSLVLVDKLLPSIDFFKLLMKRKFPISISIRPITQLEFYSSPNPDIIHEFFGHCPFLVDTNFANYTCKLGVNAYNAISKNPEHSIYFERLYWYTIEFGLVRSNNELKMLGAGIIPSRNETLNALNDKLPKTNFTITEALQKEYDVTTKQKYYYIIDRIEDLYSLDFKQLNETITYFIKNNQ